MGEVAYHGSQGLGPGRGLPTWIEIGPAKNVSWEFDGGVTNYTSYLFGKLIALICL